MYWKGLHYYLQREHIILHIVYLPVLVFTPSFIRNTSFHCTHLYLILVPRWIHRYFTQSPYALMQYLFTRFLYSLLIFYNISSYHNTSLSQNKMSIFFYLYFSTPIKGFLSYILEKL